MNLALSFIGFMADVPIPCVVLNLPFMSEASQGPRCSLMVHTCLHRGTVTFGDRTEFRTKFSSVTAFGLKHQTAYMDMGENWRSSLYEHDLRRAGLRSLVQPIRQPAFSPRCVRSS